MGFQPQRRYAAPTLNGRLPDGYRAAAPQVQAPIQAQMQYDPYAIYRGPGINTGDFAQQSPRQPLPYLPETRPMARALNRELSGEHALLQFMRALNDPAFVNSDAFLNADLSGMADAAEAMKSPSTLTYAPRPAHMGPVPVKTSMNAPRRRRGLLSGE